MAPRMIDTPLLDQLLGDRKSQILDATAANLPTQRVGSPEDVAKAILFLMTSRFVTGEVLHVDGGGRLA